MVVSDRRGDERSLEYEVTSCALAGGHGLGPTKPASATPGGARHVRCAYLGASSRRGHVRCGLYDMYIRSMSTAADDNVELSVTDARAQLAELLDTRVREGGVVYLTRYGRRVGAVVPAEVAEHLDDIEDAYWSARVEQVLAKGEPTVPWSEALARLEAEDVDS